VNTLSFLVGGVLPIVAILVFFVGMIYRIRVWMKTPQPGKMTLFPAPENPTKSVIAEAVFFPSLFKGDRILWLFAWVFHVTLALVALGHIRVITGLVDRTLMGMGMTEEGIASMSATIGGVAGIILLGTGALLLIRRLTINRVRQVSGVPDFFALLLLVAIILTGDMMRFGAHFDLGLTRDWFWSLLKFSPQVPQNGMFLVHILLAFFLIMYIPFSKILHMGGIFFTQSLIRR
jgi:nitrate reductase gamma subunit